eukprot:234440-Rhodomonas_salina.1
MCGTDIAYGAPRAFCEEGEGKCAQVSYAICLRKYYAMSGTDIVYGDTSTAYAATRTLSYLPTDQLRDV